MNEQTPEAKQAAEETVDVILLGKAQGDFRSEREWLIDQITDSNQQAADTAIAKAREEVFNAVFPKGTENGNESWEQILKAIHDTNADLSEAMKQLREADKETAKMREENITLDAELTIRERLLTKLREELELAWAIIANASGGDWSKESQEWQDAAVKWRDRVRRRKRGG